MNILALDTASYKTGYAIYKNGVITEHGTIRLKGDGETAVERTQTRISKLYRNVCSLITKHHITQVVAEDIFKDSDPSKHSAVEVLGMCRGAIIAANTQNNLPPIRFIQPVRVKAEMWGYTSSKRSHREMDRSTQKEIMCRVVEKLGYQLNTDRNNNKDNDEADAIGILVTFLKWNNHPVTHPNKA